MLQTIRQQVHTTKTSPLQFPSPFSVPLPFLNFPLIFHFHMLPSRFPSRFLSHFPLSFTNPHALPAVASAQLVAPLL